MGDKMGDSNPAETPKTNAEGFEILSETLQFKRYIQVVDRIVKSCELPACLTAMDLTNCALLLQYCVRVSLAFCRKQIPPWQGGQVRRGCQQKCVPDCQGSLPLIVA